MSLSNMRPSYSASHVLPAVSGDLARYTSRLEGMPFYFFCSSVINSSSSSGSTSTFTSKAIMKRSCPLRARLPFRIDTTNYPYTSDIQNPTGIDLSHQIPASRHPRDTPIIAVSSERTTPSLCSPATMFRSFHSSSASPHYRVTRRTQSQTYLAKDLPSVPPISAPSSLSSRMVTLPSVITPPVNAGGLPMKTISTNFKPSWRRRRRR